MRFSPVWSAMVFAMSSSAASPLSFTAHRFQLSMRTSALPASLTISNDLRQLLHLTTRYGDLDLSFRPAGTEGFSELAPRSLTVEIRGVPVAVATLEDVIRSKEAA